MRGLSSLLTLVLSVAVGVAAGAGWFAFMPPDRGSDEELAARAYDLEAELSELDKRPPSLPTHHHWERFRQYLDTYERLKVDRLSAEQEGRPDFGGDQWGGVISGPTLDLLLAARIVQGIVPVYFDRVAVEDDTARMAFYVLGAREN